MVNVIAKAWDSAWKTATGLWRFGAEPPQGRRVVTDPRLDFLQAFLSDNLNFTSLRSLLRSADSGELSQGLQLFTEMRQKDASLDSVARTRTDALTGLDYEIVSASGLQDFKGDRALADDAADFVGERFSKIEGFARALEHLATGIGTNLAVLEQVWEGMVLVAMVVVPHWRLRMESNEPGVVRVLTRGELRGIPASGPKWVVHSPNGSDGYPLAKSIMRAQAFIYLIKMLALADWAVFAEIFGMPIRVAKYRAGISPEDKSTLMDMMKNLGSKAYGVFSEAVTLEFVESSQRGTAPFKELVEWCDRTQAKIWLGGNLTSDTTGGTGTLAAASVQDEVREDLRNGDIRREGETIRSQIIAPMCAWRFRQDVPLPFFRRVKPEVVDRIQEAQLISVASQQIGLNVPLDWAHDRLGIPKPNEGEAVIKVRDFEGAFTEVTDGA